MEPLNWNDRTLFEQIIQEDTAAVMQVKQYAENHIGSFKDSKCFKIKKLNVDIERLNADNVEKEREWHELTSKNVKVYNNLKNSCETKINELIKLKSRLKELEDETYKQTKLLDEKKSNFEETQRIYKETQQVYIKNLDMFIREKGDSPDNFTAVITFKSHENFPVKFSIKNRKISAFDAGKLELDCQTKAQLEEYLQKGNGVKVLCMLRKLIKAN